MATTSQRRTRQTDTEPQTDPTVDEMLNQETEAPPEFTSDTENSGDVTNTVEFDTDTFNDTRDEQEYQRLNPPTGDWIKDTRWEISKMFNSNDSMEGDRTPQGRTVYLLVGTPHSRTANGFEYAPKFYVRMSPDKRVKVDDPSKVDNAYKLFLQAKNLYLTITGQGKNIVEKDFARFMVEQEYVVRTMNGDSGPIVLDIKVKRK